jgi:predicted dehydrogenase
LRILKENFRDKVRVGYVVDTDPERVKVINEKYGVTGVGHWQSALDGLPSVDVDFITTNPPLHCEQVVNSASYGHHIFCEKPLSLAPLESDKMIEAVRKAGVVCTVDFEWMFAESVQVLKAYLGSEGFGTLRHIVCTDKGRPPGYDIETHFLDAIMRLIGSKPVSVMGTVMVDGRPATQADVLSVSELYPQGRTHDIGMRADFIQASYLFENGLPVNYFLSALDEKMVEDAAGDSRKAGSEFMHVKHVPQDTLSEMNWTPAPTMWSKDGKWHMPTARLIKDFLDAIEEKREPLSTIENAAMVVDMTYGIYASHLRGRPVRLPLEDRRHPLKS